MRGTVRKVPLFHSIVILGEESAVLHYLPHSEQEAVSLAQGFPIWMETVLQIPPQGYCAGSFISYCKGGTWNLANGTYNPPPGQHNILEFVEVEVTNVQTAFLSSQENNALAREEDDLTEETRANATPAVVATDNVSLLTNDTGGTNNTATLLQKNHAMMDTNASLVEQLKAMKQVMKDKGIEIPPDFVDLTKEVGKEKDVEMSGNEEVDGANGAAVAGGEEDTPDTTGATDVEGTADPTKVPVPESPMRTTGVSQGLPLGPTEFLNTMNGQQQDIGDSSMKPARSPREERTTPAKYNRQVEEPHQPTPSPTGNGRVLRSQSRGNDTAQKSKNE